MWACTLLYSVQVCIKRVDQTLGRHFKLYFRIETSLTSFQITMIMIKLYDKKTKC